MHQFGVWHEGGHHTIQGLPILKHLLRTLHGDVMVRALFPKSMQRKWN
ncbi:MAG: hypothetical protein ACRDBT_07775 [Aeromonas sp.]